MEKTEHYIMKGCVKIWEGLACTIDIWLFLFLIIDIERLQNLEQKLQTLSKELAWSVVRQMEQRAIDAGKVLQVEKTKLKKNEEKVIYLSICVYLSDLSLCIDGSSQRNPREEKER